MFGGEEFKFTCPIFAHRNIEYTGRFCEDGDVVTSWIHPDTKETKTSTMYGHGEYDNTKIFELIVSGKWIITQKESV